jgi:hypothetical protein
VWGHRDAALDCKTAAGVVAGGRDGACGAGVYPCILACVLRAEGNALSFSERTTGSDTWLLWS